MEGKIIETKVCKHCGMLFSITDKDSKFYDKVSPIFADKKYQIPSPTFCPECRWQRRLSFRNERKLYKRTCDLTGKDSISIYSPDKPYKVYEHKARRGDQRDPLAYGQERDSNKSFFQQWKSLYERVPKIALNGHDSNENSSYTNYTVWTKNGYFNFGGGYTENVYYSTLLLRCKNCVDSHFTLDSQECYEATYCDKCYNLYCSNHCDDCRDSYFLEDCIGCNNCFACMHLNNASYHVFNKPVTKEEYQGIVQKFIQRDPVIISQITDFFHKVPYNQWYIKNSEDCSGHNIKDAKHCDTCFNVKDGEHLKYCETAISGIKDCYDVGQGGLNIHLCYEGMTSSMNVYHALYTFVVRENSQHLLYCCDMSNCTHCFGCVGLRNVSYCILNKQYTQTEYENIAPQIIEKMITDGEWGEFFPSHISPFGYNETVAMQYMPLDKETAIASGFKRSDFEPPFPKVEKMLQASELPTIQNCTDDILQQAIICEISGKPFRIIKQELEFYRKHQIALPTKHPDVRNAERIKSKAPRNLWERTCAKCGIAIQTAYEPRRPEIVYCEACYNKEI